MPARQRAVAALAVGLAAGASVLVGGALAQGRPVTLLASVPAAHYGGPLVWPGTVIRASSRLGLLEPAERNRGGRNEIVLLRSRDDGVSWSADSIIARLDTDLYDPAALRLDDGTILVAAHSDRGLHFFRGDADGAHWTAGALLQPPPGHGFAEAFLRLLPGGRVALLFADIGPSPAPAQYRTRTSVDGGASWSGERTIGSGGAIRDAIRGALSAPDDSGRVLAVWASRTGPGSAVAVYGRLLASRNLKPLTPARLLASTDPTPGFYGDYPVALLCAGRFVVVATPWDSRGAGDGRFAIADRDAALGADSALAGLEVRGDSVAKGFGRAWIVRRWAGDLLVTWVEVPADGRTRIRRLTLPTQCQP